MVRVFPLLEWFGRGFDEDVELVEEGVGAEGEDFGDEV